MRALTAKQIIDKKRVIYEFDGRFLECFGKPERNAIWLIFGKSGNGKTHLVLTLVKYLAEKFGVVEYISLEEGDKQSFSIALQHVNMRDVARFRLVPPIPKEQIKERISKKRGADFEVIDSVQYSDLTYSEHKELKNQRSTKRKMLIYISHANGNNPDGKTADKIRYDADIKVHVIGFVAKVKSRYGGNKVFIIWEQGAKEYWGKKYNSVITGKYWPGDKK